MAKQKRKLQSPAPVVDGGWPSSPHGGMAQRQRVCNEGRGAQQRPCSAVTRCKHFVPKIWEPSDRRPLSERTAPASAARLVEDGSLSTWKFRTSATFETANFPSILHSRPGSPLTPLSKARSSIMRWATVQGGTTGRSTHLQCFSPPFHPSTFSRS